MLTKKIFPVILILLLSLSASLNSCKKLSNEELLTAHAWKFKSMVTNSTDEDTQVLVAFAAALLTNGTIEFMSGGDYILTTGLGDDTGTWVLEDEETLILDAGSGDESVNEIIELTDKDLVFRESMYDDINEEFYTVTTSWVKQD